MRMDQVGANFADEPDALAQRFQVLQWPHGLHQIGKDMPAHAEVAGGISEIAFFAGGQFDVKLIAQTAQEVDDVRLAAAHLSAGNDK